MSAALAWAVLVVGIVSYVAAFDIYAHIHHHTMMTGQFRDWLFDPITGPFIAAGWAGLFIGLTYHWFLRRRG